MEALQRNNYLVVLQGGRMYTVEDILKLPDGVRAELLDGEMYLMATPTRTHQETLGWLFFEVESFIRRQKGKCKVLPAPFAVFLMNDDKNYVEPDLLVVCERDKARLQMDGCHGAPNWAIEIVSPSSRTMDYVRKLKAYLAAGVEEYWIVDPEKELVQVYRLRQSAQDGGQGGLQAEENLAQPEEYHFSDCVESGIIEELSLDFTELKEYLEEL